MEAKEVTVKEVPVTPFVSKKSPQFIAALVASIGAISLGTVVSWTSPALPQIKQSETFSDLTVQQETWIASLAPLGAIVGGPIAGLAVEKLGRQRSMFLLCLPFFLGWFSIAFASHVVMLYVGRFVTGICAGALCLMIPIYISEIAEESIRGLASAPFAINTGVGILFTYVIGAFVPWSTLTLIHGAIPIIFMICLYYVPESPPWLVQQGRKARAGKALKCLRGAKWLEQVMPELNEMQASMENNYRGSFELGYLLEREALKPIGISIALMILQQGAGISIVIFFAAQIFGAAGVDNPQVSSIIIASVMVLSIFVSFMFIDKAGRRVLLIASGLGSSLSLIGLGLFFYIKALNDGIGPEHLNWLPLASLIAFNVAYNTGLGGVPWIYMAETLPSYVKGSGSAIATSSSWLLAFLVTKTFEDASSVLGIHGCYWLLALVSAFGAIFVYVFVPETKGRSLDEIQKYFKPKNQELVKA